MRERPEHRPLCVHDPCDVRCTSLECITCSWPPTPRALTRCAAWRRCVASAASAQPRSVRSTPIATAPCSIGCGAASTRWSAARTRNGWTKTSPPQTGVARVSRAPAAPVDLGEARLLCQTAKVAFDHETVGAHLRAGTLKCRQIEQLSGGRPRRADGRGALLHEAGERAPGPSPRPLRAGRADRSGERRVPVLRSSPRHARPWVRARPSRRARPLPVDRARWPPVDDRPHPLGRSRATRVKRERRTPSRRC